MLNEVQCRECCQQDVKTGRSVQTFPLSLAAEGEQVRIVLIRGGCRRAERLLSMGVKVDEIVTVVNCQGNGGKVIDSRSGRFAMGGGIAHSISVTRVDGGR